MFHIAAFLEFNMTSVVGTPDAVASGLRAFFEETGADEIMVSSQIFDHQARLRSFEIAAHAAGLSGPRKPHPS